MSKRSLLSTLLFISAASLVLVVVAALRYGYDRSAALAFAAGAGLLIAVAAFLWIDRRRSRTREDRPLTRRAIRVGLALGLLWVVEIGINNFVAPPLPARDWIDNGFWSAIALSMLVLAAVATFRSGSLVRGVETGAWSGLASGLVACCMGLSMIVFGMALLIGDPLASSEWAERGADSLAPTISAYFALETLAGALGHLTVLGVAMGALLGALGGLLGGALRWLSRRRWGKPLW